MDGWRGGAASVYNIPSSHVREPRWVCPLHDGRVTHPKPCGTPNFRGSKKRAHPEGVPRKRPRRIIRRRRTSVREGSCLREGHRPELSCARRELVLVDAIRTAHGEARSLVDPTCTAASSPRLPNPHCPRSSNGTAKALRLRSLNAVLAPSQEAKFAKAGGGCGETKRLKKASRQCSKRRAPNQNLPGECVVGVFRDAQRIERETLFSRGRVVLAGEDLSAGRRARGASVREGLSVVWGHLTAEPPLLSPCVARNSTSRPRSTGRGDVVAGCSPSFRRSSSCSWG